MPKIIVTDTNGKTHEIDGEKGRSLMSVLHENGLVEAVCGGQCACATCHVYIDTSFLDFLPPASEIESELLESSLEERDNSRLSCQLIIDERFEGIRLEVADEA